MTMMTTQTNTQSQHTAGGLNFALTVLATAVLTLMLVPAAVLGVSYIAGGAATSTILFVYLFALFTNGPFLLAALAITAGAVAMPRLATSLYHHDHA